MKFETFNDKVSLANCKGSSQIFFEPTSERPQARVRREALAKQICQECVIIDVCREWAMSHSEAGIWGGLNEEERVIRGASVAPTHSNGLKRRVNRTLSATQSLLQ